jgi:general stress protein YciG
MLSSCTTVFHLKKELFMQDSDFPQAVPSDSTQPRRSARGFAAMSPERQREIASLGGRAAHKSGHAHEFNSDEARAAGVLRHQKRKFDLQS